VMAKGYPKEIRRGVGLDAVPMMRRLAHDVSFSDG
jgi:hypothetical protein